MVPGEGKKNSLKIWVLKGGPSPEAEVSRKTAMAVTKALKEKGYTVEEKEFTSELLGEFFHNPPDRVFLALHGKPGEDGTVQGFLETLRIPYTFSSLLGSALCMDKYRTRIFLKDHFPQPRFVFLFGNDPLPSFLPFSPPWVVKPNRGGSSVGVTIVTTFSELGFAVEKARSVDSEVLIEEYIEGREVSVGVLHGRVLGIVEIQPKDSFYSYQAKYSGESKYIVDPEISPEIRKKLVSKTEEAFRLLDLRGCARADFILKGATPYFLEMNTIPGLTETSLLPKMAYAKGLTFPDFIESILFPPGEEP